MKCRTNCQEAEREKGTRGRLFSSLSLAASLSLLSSRWSACKVYLFSMLIHRVHKLAEHTYKRGGAFVWHCLFSVGCLALASWPAWKNWTTLEGQGETETERVLARSRSHKASRKSQLNRQPAGQSKLTLGSARSGRERANKSLAGQTARAAGN